jgi:hypothetical protein
MDAIFKEMPVFDKYREYYLSDDEYRKLQEKLLENPTTGAVIKGTGGLRKMRWSDTSRGKGKRGGLRVIYYWYVSEHQFLMFTLYDKDELADLTDKQRKLFKSALAAELMQ